MKKGGDASPKDRRLRKYGITEAQWWALFTKQGGRCAICQIKWMPTDKRDLSVDHDHVTGNIRGLLCNNCNIILGLVKDNPNTLHAAGIYLEAQDV